MFRSKFIWVSAFAIALISACSSGTDADETSGVFPERWANNPAGYGSEIYSVAKGDSVNGFQCSVYESENAVIESSIEFQSGFEIKAIYHNLIKNDSIKVTVFVSMEPYTKKTMEDMCNKMTQSADTANGAYVVCEDDYIKEVAFGSYTESDSIAIEKTKNRAIEHCKQQDMDYGEAADDDSVVEPSCEADSLFRADGSYEVDIPDNCL